MATLERTTLTAEELALHSPVVITIVKPGEKETPVHHIISILTLYFKVLYRTGKGRQQTELRLFFHHSPYLVSSFDGPAGEEGYPGEAQILVHGEHPHSQQVGLTQMVDEAANVAKESRIDTVYISHLDKMKTKKRHRSLCIDLVTLLNLVDWKLLTNLLS